MRRRADDATKLSGREEISERPCAFLLLTSNLASILTH